MGGGAIGLEGPCSVCTCCTRAAIATSRAGEEEAGAGSDQGGGHTAWPHGGASTSDTNIGCEGRRCCCQAPTVETVCKEEVGGERRRDAPSLYGVKRVVEGAHAIPRGPTKCESDLRPDQEAGDPDRFYGSQL